MREAYIVSTARTPLAKSVGGVQCNSPSAAGGLVSRGRSKTSRSLKVVRLTTSSLALRLRVEPRIQHGTADRPSRRASRRNFRNDDGPPVFVRV